MGRGNLKEAEQKLRRSLEINQMRNTSKLLTASRLNDLSLILQKLGKFEEALEKQKSCLKIR